VVGGLYLVEMLGAEGIDDSGKTDMVSEPETRSE